MNNEFDPAIAAIQRIDAVPTILEVVCRTTGMGFAAVARVTEERWIACGVRDEIAFGLEPGGELQIETTICNEIRGHHRPVLIENVAEDEAFCQHHTPARYGFQSYISMPIILPDGSFFGTLCAIDPKPAKLKTPEVIGMFKLFAELIAFHLDAHDRLARSEALVAEKVAEARLREQFVAVLGHDLRNPLASIDAGVRMVLKASIDDRARSILGMMQTSIGRMAELIEAVMQFARGRLGGGFAVAPTPTTDLPETLQAVVGEMRASHPDRVIETRFDLSGAVDCDRDRIAQLFSNLLGNSLVHGDPARPVTVDASVGGGAFVLAVANGGGPIPPELLENLFKPFMRASDQPGQQGLGLGLYIASEIAIAHGGTLEASSSGDQVCFTFRMPVRAQESRTPGLEAGAA